AGRPPTVRETPSCGGREPGIPCSRHANRTPPAPRWTSGHGWHTPPDGVSTQSEGSAPGPMNSSGRLPLGLIDPGRVCQPAGMSNRAPAVATSWTDADEAVDEAVDGGR